MRWIHQLSAAADVAPDVLGGKASGLVVLRRLGLPVPPGFVIGTGACRAFLRDGRFPAGLDAELAAAVALLETETGRRFGGRERPLAVSVRSGAVLSMPGMLRTVLNVGLTTEATAGLAGIDAVPDDPMTQLEQAVRAVFESWDAPRARTYRELHGIPHELGTAVTVQAMVFGNRDERSGAGVAFSRDPTTGERVPFGEVLFGRQGEDVVSGGSLTRPLGEVADREPAVWTGLLGALERIESHYRDACSVEFTFETGELSLLQVRPGGFTGRALVRIAVDLADAGLIERREALRRVSPADVRRARTPRIATDGTDVLARGLGACPGVATGRVATTADDAVRMAAAGPVVLVRPETSPADVHGLAAAAGVVTARGGPASHAAVVARAMGKPAVVGVGQLSVAAGTLVTVDGTGGRVVLGRAPVVTAAADPHLDRLLEWADDERDGVTFW